MARFFTAEYKKEFSLDPIDGKITKADEAINFLDRYRPKQIGYQAGSLILEVSCQDKNQQIIIYRTKQNIEAILRMFQVGSEIELEGLEVKTLWQYNKVVGISSFLEDIDYYDSTPKPEEEPKKEHVSLIEHRRQLVKSRRATT
ncbi:MAG: hypothetical protein AABX29_08710 [Nanoarchaeota archaeon]